MLKRRVIAAVFTGFALFGGIAAAVAPAVTAGAPAAAQPLMTYHG
jgi:hypothetical protein